MCLTATIISNKAALIWRTVRPTGRVVLPRLGPPISIANGAIPSFDVSTNLDAAFVIIAVRFEGLPAPDVLRSAPHDLGHVGVLRIRPTQFRLDPPPHDLVGGVLRAPGSAALVLGEVLPLRDARRVRQAAGFAVVRQAIGVRLRPGGERPRPAHRDVPLTSVVFASTTVVSVQPLLLAIVHGGLPVLPDLNGVRL